MAEGLSKLGDITINGMPLREGAPHIMSVTFHGVRSEVLLHTLEEFEYIFPQEVHAPVIRENRVQH